VAAWAGCVAGALEARDYIGAIEAAGFVDVKLAPVYMDKSVIDGAVEQLELKEIVAEDDSLYHSVFSAKVTAYKA